MQRAVLAFLKAAAVPLADPELRQTPERVAAAWSDELIDGYQTTPAQALGELLPVGKGTTYVSLTHLDFVGVCPHHLLPYRGLAHLAYVPTKHIAGFGRFPALIDVLAHRLTVQEVVAKQIADALVDTLGASGAGVVLEAEHACMRVRGQRRGQSRAVVEASAGTFDSAAMTRLWAAIRTGPKRPKGSR
jgi:GTP cyclohydrolase I